MHVLYWHYVCVQSYVCVCEYMCVFHCALFEYVGIGSSGVSMFHVSILMSVLVLNGEVL